MIPLVYHPAYDFTAFGLERLHPFDGRKYRRIRDALVARGLRRRSDFARPRPAGRAELLRIHSDEYLRSLRLAKVLARILEIPIVGRLPAWVIEGLVDKTLGEALDAVRPDLVVYNAGSDPFVDDPLAGYRLSGAELAERDLMVVSAARERRIAVAMVLSGGYSNESWKIHTDAIEDIVVRFDRDT